MQLIFYKDEYIGILITLALVVSFFLKDFILMLIQLLVVLRLVINMPSTNVKYIRAVLAGFFTLMVCLILIGQNYYAEICAQWLFIGFIYLCYLDIKTIKESHKE